MEPRRLFLSVVLAGAALWCVGRVQQVHSEEKTAAKTEKFAPVAPLAVLTQGQEESLAGLRKAAAAETPKFREIEHRAEFLAEMFNVKQYAEKSDVKAAAGGRDQSLELAKAAKAKDAAGVKKIVAGLEDPIKKSGQTAGETTAPVAPYKPVATVHSLMEVQQDLFDRMKKTLDAPNDEGFKSIERDAQLLAELSNVNRHQKAEKADYVNWATQARDQSLQLAKSAAARDADVAKGMLRQIHATCGACHDKYQ